MIKDGKNYNKYLRQNKKSSERPGEKYTSPLTPSSSNSWWYYFQKFNVELFLAVLLVSGIVCIVFTGLRLRNEEEGRNILQQIADEQSFAWDEEYQGGYKVIFYEYPRITYSKYDTLPKDLKINWNASSVTLIQADQMMQQDATLEVELNGVIFKPENVYRTDYRVKLLRKTGETGIIARWANYNLVLVLLEDYGDKVVILLGLKEIWSKN